MDINENEMLDESTLKVEGGLGDEIWEEELLLHASMDVDEMIRHYVRVESAKGTFDPHEVVVRITAWKSRKSWAIKKLQSMKIKW